MRQILISAITIAISVYIIFGFILFLFQEKYIYFPNEQDFYKCPGFADAEKINLQGTRFYYKYISDTLVVFYHGNAGSACDRAFFKSIFEKNKYSYIFVEYAGYSNDKKIPNKNRILQDVVRVNEFIKNKSPKKIILMGESIGTGPAAFHSTLFPADKIILINPFNQLVEVAQKHYPYYPVKLLFRNNFENDVWLKTFGGEILLLHAGNDSIIPLSSSKKLYNFLINKNKKIQYVVVGADHNDIYDFELTWETLNKFIKTY